MIDLRSDTVTKPTQAMRQAMLSAEVGDDVFGDDPTVNALQEKFAAIMGKEAALFCPTGTMANQIAIAVHTSPGDEIICEASCHIRNYESGAPAALSGVMLNAIEGIRGAYSAQEAELRIRPTDSHFAQTRLIWVENTANRGGGAIFPQENAIALRDLADKYSLAMHLDGARIWNASAASGVSERVLAEPFDTVTACLSKGLGCPVGSLIAGKANVIHRAHRFRKRFGGGMRQTGVLAACGIYALDNHRKRLSDDHRRARILAETVAEIIAFDIDLSSVQTNIVIFDVSRAGLDGIKAAEMLKSKGILSIPFGLKVRLVTHLDVDDHMIDQAVSAIRSLFSEIKPISDGR